jgi:hypothetical protein
MPPLTTDVWVLALAAVAASGQACTLLFWSDT